MYLNRNLERGCEGFTSIRQILADGGIRGRRVDGKDKTLNGVLNGTRCGRPIVEVV
jgi:hypothetical protein